MKITSLASLVAQIDGMQLCLPAYKQEFRWNSRQTLEYISSLFRGFPGGNLVFWSPTPAAEKVTGAEYVVDGHQRLAVIYGALRGHAPSFSPGSALLEWPLNYHAGRDEFAFGTPGADGDPFWISLPAFFAPPHPESGRAIMSLYPHCSSDMRLEKVMRRVSQLANLKDHRIVVEYMPDCTSLVDCERISAIANFAQE